MADTLFAVCDIDTVRATISKIVYAENGRLIARVNLDPGSIRDPQGRRRMLHSVLGSMLEPMIGQLYEFSGKTEWDNKYKQFQLRFDSYRTILPTDRDGIASYLIDVARWIGPSHAKALLDAFGAESLTVLREEPDRVAALSIAGLTTDRVKEMSQSLKDNAELEAAAIEVNNLLGGVMGPATVRKAIRKWRSDAATIIKANPFVLMELYGVGFISADAVAKKLGGDPQDLHRHVAALCHILAEAANRDGHTVCSAAYVQMEGQKLVGGLRPDVVQPIENDDALVEFDGQYFAAGGIARAERYVGNKLASMLSGASKTSDTTGEVPQDEGSAKRRSIFPPINTEGLAEDQVAAVAVFQDAQTFILCGAPGTGKTYTVARIVRSLTATGLRVSLCAPTGKAAKQMGVALADVGGGSASTIHSLLAPQIDEETGEFSFSKCESDPLDCDVIVIDEFSMVDIMLCRSLLRAVPETTRILIVGDHYQLPSVGPGAVLRDLLKAGVPSFELKQIKRNAGTIVRACHAIKDGRAPQADARLDLPTGANWRHIDAGGPDEIKAVIRVLIETKLQAAGVDKLWGVQLISPVNEAGPLSCEVLNELAKSLLNNVPPPEKLSFAVGDKVVRTKNGYASGYFPPDDPNMTHIDPPEEEIRIVNGDLGVVTAIEAKEITVQLRYPDRVVHIPRRDHHLKLAYCLTAHKMQGSEVDVVVLPIHGDTLKTKITNREWIYTAFSRAKKFLITVGDAAALRPMIARVGNTRRQTMLQKYLEQSIGPKPAPCSEFDDL